MSACRAGLWVALAACVGTAAAEEKPLWEFGMGAGAIAFPDYRGSDEMEVYPVPLPYVIYRGKFVKADREGLRGELFDRRYAELSISVGGSIPVNSDDNDVREGMPDLKPTLELGPSLDLHLWKSDSSTIKLDLVMPLRVPITIEGSPQVIGWLFSPRLNLDVQNLGATEWSLGIGAGPMFASSRYHDYFYSVTPRYATQDRPAYAADGGYSGVHVLASLSKRFPRYWIGAYVRLDHLAGVAFENSPLMEQDYAIAGGIGFAWMLRKSKRMIEAEE